MRYNFKPKLICCRRTGVWRGCCIHPGNAYKHAIPNLILHDFLQTFTLCLHAFSYFLHCLDAGPVWGKEQVYDEGDLLPHDLRHRHTERPVCFRRRDGCDYRQQPQGLRALLIRRWTWNFLSLHCKRSTCKKCWIIFFFTFYILCYWLTIYFGKMSVFTPATLRNCNTLFQQF